MAAKVIDKAYSDMLKEFLRISLLELVHDWQGNPTNKENNTMRVQRNVTMSMFIPEDIDNLVDSIKPDLPWAEDHFQERISGNPTNPGQTYKWWPYHTNLDGDKKYLNETFSHTYQERYWPKFIPGVQFKGFSRADIYETPNYGIRFQYGDLEDVINLLSNNPTTRQAYLPIWFPEDTWAANNQERVPCSLGYYFYYEHGKLHCNYIIRSCDMFRHLRNDIYMTARLLQHVAEQVSIRNNNGNKVEVGTLNMTIFNLHLFVNDLYTFKKREQKIGTWIE